MHHSSKRVLIFGAGLVTGPLVDYLLEHGYGVTIASRTPEKGEAHCRGREGTSVIGFDVTKDIAKIDSLLEECDIAVSMLPYIHHVTIAKRCIAKGKNLVTTSYVSDAMRELDDEARAAGIILLNECGLDPGIDHMSAMSVIDRIHEAGGKILSFTSYCGGLPAPEANTNPLGYKFSWSPRGVILASRNPATFLKDGETVNIPGPQLFSNYEIINMPDVGELEGYPNRNSLPYIETYKVPEALGIFRGTLRYRGWCDSLKALGDIGLLDDTEQDFSGTSFVELLTRNIPAGPGNPKVRVAEFLGIENESHPIQVLDWLGFFSADPIPTSNSSPLDILVDIMLEKMQYREGERDMVILEHQFLAEVSGRRENLTSTLIGYGIPNGRTAMSRMVGIPAGIAVALVLEQKISAKGVQVPVTKEIYAPILKDLEKYDISFSERIG